MVRRRSRAIVVVAFFPVLGFAVWHAVYHRFLTDDAFISFRYARNLIEGHGLVFNPGEQVEGYTNFLWVLELAAVWKVFGLRPEIASLALSALCTAGTLVVTALLALGTPFHRWRWLAAWGALVLLVSNRSFAVWTTGGLETRQFTLLVVLAVWLLSLCPTHRSAPLLASFALAAAEYTRPEGLMIGGLCLLWYVGDAWAHRRLTLRGVLALGLPFTLLVGGHFLWRHAYYGDWLPNTYYAKVVRPWPEEGIRYLAVVIIQHGLYLIWPLALAGLIARLVARRDSLFVLFALLLGAHAAYVVRIGGDHFEFRPFDLHWPLLAVAAADGLLLIGAGIVRALPSLPGALRHGLAWLTVATLFGVVLFCSTVLQVAQNVLTRARGSRDNTLMLHEDVTWRDFPLPYAFPGLRTLIPIYNQLGRDCIRHSVGISQWELKLFCEGRRAQWEPYEYLVGSRLFPESAVTYEQCIGVMAYHMADLTVIDGFGLTDRTIARARVAAPNSRRAMGHDRRASAEYLRRRGLNLIVCPPVSSPEAALQIACFAVRLRDDLWMPFNPYDFRWPKENLRGRPVYAALDFGPGEASANWVIHAGQLLRGRESLGEFDRGMDSWRLRGKAMQGQPRPHEVAGQGVIGLSVGAGLINSDHPTLGDRATGEALSPPFTSQPGDVLVFLVGGGSDPHVGVQLLADGDVVHEWRGWIQPWLMSEFLVPVVCQLDPWAGKALQIRVFDESAEPGGHVLADHFLLMRAEGPAPGPGLPLFSPG
jgi:arabinofuranosyltransferase